MRGLGVGLRFFGVGLRDFQGLLRESGMGSLDFRGLLREFVLGSRDFRWLLRDFGMGLREFQLNYNTRLKISRVLHERHTEECSQQIAYLIKIIFSSPLSTLPCFSSVTVSPSLRLVNTIGVTVDEAFAAISSKSAFINGCPAWT